MRKKLKSSSCGSSSIFKKSFIALSPLLVSGLFSLDAHASKDGSDFSDAITKPDTTPSVASTVTKADAVANGTTMPVGGLPPSTTGTSGTTPPSGTGPVLTPPPTRFGSTTGMGGMGGLYPSNIDQCQYGYEFDPKYGCSSTYKKVNNMQMMSTIGQQAGASVISQMGTSSTSDLQSNTTAGQKQALQQAATLAKNASYLGAATAAATLYSGYSALSLGQTHLDNAEEISTGIKNTDQNIVKEDARVDGKVAFYKGDADAIKEQIVSKYGLIDASNAVAIRGITTVGRNAAAEQKAAGESARSTGAMIALGGLTQAASAYMSYKNAKSLEDQANSLTQGTYTPTAIAITTPASGNSNTGTSGSSPITGSGAAPSDDNSADATDTSAGNLGNLGTMADPNPFASGVPTGQGGSFTEGAPASGEGGGGGGDIGGGGGTPDAQKTAAQDNQPHPAGNGDGAAYESGGTFLGASGGGAAKGGAEGGINFADMMKNLMGKKDEGDPAPGTVEFGTARDAPLSLLGPEADLFKRVHDTLQSKQSHGAVGG